MRRCRAVAVTALAAASQPAAHSLTPTLPLSLIAVPQGPWKRLGLSRTTKLSALSAVLGATVLFSSWAVRCSLLLIFMILVRCNLKTDEVRLAARQASRFRR